MRPLLVVLLLACNDDLVLSPPGDDAPPDAQGWCGVQAIFQSNCLSCHSAASHLGDLDLETDPHAALVGVQAAGDASRTLVIAGDPDNSALLAKLQPDPPFGGMMPPGVPLSAARVELVRQWIADGADATCDDPIDPGDPTRHHPTNYALPGEHGWSAKHQEEVCVDCHGDTLEGNGAAASCDTCHPSGWREDCTFCHGDPRDGTGSPPRHISGVDDGRSATYIPHRAHTSDTPRHLAFACDTCHTTPNDVLSLGHLFLGDTTPGRAETSFLGGLSDAGTWNGNGQCSNLYCHGNGRGDNGTVLHTASATACSSCHPDRTSGRDAWGRMSGEHEDHLREGIGCHECHSPTVSSSTAISTPALHVDGAVQTGFAGTITMTAGRCTGSCHGESHTSESWR